MRSLALKLSLFLVPAALAGALAGCGGARPAAGPAANAAPEPAPEGMVRIPGGTFEMGTNHGYAYEGPVHEVTLSPYYLDIYPVTNAKFREFVEATRYETVAEKEGWSGVFVTKRKAWEPVKGADWEHPEGAGSSIEGKDDYPVVQVCWDDAVAYAKWAGKRLPTEAEFEFAARGGLEGKTYAWGDELTPDGKFMCNIWQGTFPKEDEGKDGYRGIAPTGKFPPNGYGLYDMTANVWEWVADRFSNDYYSRSPAENPKGPDTGEERVIRAGSFLCSANFCAGYRVAARNKNTPDSATNHMGFRCAKDGR